MLAHRSHPRCHVSSAVPLLLSVGLLLPLVPTSAFAAERTIEISSEKSDDGKSTVTVVISGIPPEELGSEGMKALLGYLTGQRSLDGLIPGAKGAKAAEPAPRAIGGDRDEREFDLELNIHWRRATDDKDDDSEGKSKKPGEPKAPGELKTHYPSKEGGTTLDSIKKMISGGAGEAKPAASDKPVDAKKGESRRNTAEVDAILKNVGTLQKEILEQTRNIERVKGLAAGAEKNPPGPEVARKVAEAAAELEKLTRDIERRSREVEEALDRARAKLAEPGPGAASKPKEEPKKKPKKQKKAGQPKTVNEPK